MVEAKRKKYGLLKDLVVTGESCLADCQRFHFLQKMNKTEPSLLLRG